jgi:hypothetical protein
MKDAADIYQLYTNRSTSRGMLIQQMQQVRDQYNGDIVVPLPEITVGERPSVANLLNQGLDQMALRVSSTLPDISYPSLRPGIKLHDDRAQRRRKANFGWWEASNMELLLRRRARHLLGYGTTPVVILPDMKEGVPRWHIRNPLSTFPAHTRNPDDLHPDDAVFAYRRTGQDLKEIFGSMPGYEPGMAYEVLEYVDAYETTMIVVGPGMGSDEMSFFSGRGKQIINLEPPSVYMVGGVKRRGGGKSLLRIDSHPNLAGISPLVMPGRITLDRMQGMFDQTIGMYQTQARLMALELLAVEHGVFPDEWLVARPNEVPDIVVQADGRRGQIGIVRGGEVIARPIVPGTQTYPTMDRLERAQRQNGGIPAEFGGESSTNIRTGKRGDSILSSTIDFPIQEAQQILQFALQQENKIAVAQVKAYFGKQQKSFYVYWKGAKGLIDYTPDETFDTDNNMVSFSHAGSDENSLIVGIGQRVGLKMMSIQRAAELDPLIDDPEEEHNRVVSEALEATVLASLQQAGQSGSVGVHDLASIAQAVLTNRQNLYTAVLAAQKAAQQRQATSGPQGAPDGPAAPGSPDAQPGLTAGTPAAAGAAVPATIGQASPDLTNLSGLLSALHGPQAAAKAS